jgi:hypothetical protein
MFVDRDGNGKITGRFGVQQRTEQEDVAADAPELRLLDARTAARTAIDAGFGAALTAGLSFDGKVIQIDDTGRANIAAVAVRALGVALGLPGMLWSEDFFWRTADNSPLPLTAAKMLAMGQAAADQYTALVYRRGALKDAVDAAATAEDVEAIDTSF